MSSEYYDVTETLPVQPEAAAAPDDRAVSSNMESNPSEDAALPGDDKKCAPSESTGQRVSSPTGDTSDQPQVNGNLQTPTSQMQFAMSSSASAPTTVSKVKSGREMLAQSAQDIVEELNNKRTQDTQMLADFKAGLELHTQRVVEQTEENLFKMYEKQSAIVQEKLQELNETLQRIDQLESEMQEFKQALGMLYVDMNEK